MPVTQRILALASLALVAGGMAGAAEAQPSAKQARVGYLGYVGSTGEKRHLEAFMAGLRELGWIAGEKLAVVARWAERSDEKLRNLAGELARGGVDVIVADGAPAARAAKDASPSVPVVVVGVGDPVGRGLVASLERPGGNVTGVTDYSGVLGRKRLELLREILPRLSRLAVLFHPEWPAHVADLEVTRAAARAIGVEVLPVEARGPDELDPAFSSMAQARAEALVVLPRGRRTETRIVELVARRRLPSLHTNRTGVSLGGLVSLQGKWAAPYRQAAAFVDRILKGAKPGDLPVEHPTGFELTVNLKTAQALGLTIPQSVLDRADEVVRVSASGGGQKKP